MSQNVTYRQKIRFLLESGSTNKVKCCGQFVSKCMVPSVLT